MASSKVRQNWSCPSVGYLFFLSPPISGTCVIVCRLVTYTEGICGDYCRCQLSVLREWLAAASHHRKNGYLSQTILISWDVRGCVLFFEIISFFWLLRRTCSHWLLNAIIINIYFRSKILSLFFEILGLKSCQKFLIWLRASPGHTLVSFSSYIISVCHAIALRILHVSRDSVIFLFYSSSTVRSLLSIVRIKREEEPGLASFSLSLSFSLVFLPLLPFFLSCASYDSYIPFFVFFFLVLFFIWSFASSFVATIYYFSIDFCWPLRLPRHSDGLGCCHAIPLALVHPPISSPISLHFCTIRSENGHSPIIFLFPSTTHQTLGLIHFFFL